MDALHQAGYASVMKIDTTVPLSADVMAALDSSPARR
jgi:hypothetical protein